MKNGESIHEEIYKKMQGKPEKEKKLRVWNTMKNYFGFYEEWIRVCSRLSGSPDNPNKELLRRWTS